MSDYTLFFSVFSIFTNLICIIPSIIFLTDKNIYDALLILETGIASFLHHLNNNVPTILNEKIFPEREPILYVDLLCTYILIINIASYLAFYKNYYYRIIILLTVIPFQIYFLTQNNEIQKYISFGSIGLISIKIIINTFEYNLWTKKGIFFLTGGIILNILQIIFYEYLQVKYVYYGHLYHGFHHFCAFTSIIIYHYLPTYYDNKSFIINSRQNSNIIEESSEYELNIKKSNYNNYGNNNPSFSEKNDDVQDISIELNVQDISIELIEYSLNNTQ
jgi:hypothetical protein